MRRQRGGKKWKEGSDGCIFYPAVSCQGDPKTNVVDMGFLSKIIPKGSIDESVENFIATHFPHIVAGKGVLIAERRCTPQFKSTNLNTGGLPVKNGPCKALDEKHPELYTNFITEKYDDKNFYQTVKEEPYISDTLLKLKLLRRALNAAVALVPDDGPWVLGFDFHIGNIFVKQGAEPYSSLADWGRTILIENPKDPMSLRRGIRQGLQYIQSSGLQHFINYPEVPQFSDFMRESLNITYEEAVTHKTISENIDNLRIMNVYGILASIIDSKTISFSDPITLITDLTSTASQQGVINALNKNIIIPGISNYIDIDTFFPKSNASVTRGGKRTRKQKKTLKKKSVRKTRR